MLQLKAPSVRKTISLFEKQHYSISISYFCTVQFLVLTRFRLMFCRAKVAFDDFFKFQKCARYRLLAVLFKQH